MTAVSVDLGSGTTVGTTPSIGVEPHDNWQQEFGFPNFTSTNLEDDSETATTLDLELATAAGNITTRATGSGDLFNMFTRAAGCRIELENTQLIITQIPYSTYNVYLYFCESSSSTSGPLYEFTDGTTSYYYETQGSDNFDSGTLTRVTSESSGTPDTTGNYILFEGLSSASVTITGNGDSGNANDIGFVGLQIVESTVASASITASITEQGDTVAASINAVASTSASIAEQGDTVAAAMIVPVTIDASVLEQGDTVAALLNGVISISANVPEQGDTIAAALNLIAQVAASIDEDGGIISATIVTSAMDDIGDIEIASKTSITALASKTSRVVVA